MNAYRIHGFNAGLRLATGCVRDRADGHRAVAVTTVAVSETFGRSSNVDVGGI